MTMPTSVVALLDGRGVRRSYPTMCTSSDEDCVNCSILWRNAAVKARIATRLETPASWAIRCCNELFFRWDPGISESATAIARRYSRDLT